MKNLIFFLGICTLLISCAKKTSQLAYQRTGEVVCTGHDDRVLELRSKSVGSSLHDASFYADVSAFENLLYKGIPNSNQELPLIESKKNTATTNEYFKGFFDNGTYLDYITSQRVTGHDQSGDNHFVEKNITIDLVALRKHLEDKNIIKKFGIE